MGHLLPGLLFLAVRVVRSCEYAGDGCERGVLYALALIGGVIEKTKSMRNEPN